MNTYAQKLIKNDKTNQKTKVREFIFSYVKNCNKVVGLAGPNINKYIDFCKSKGLNSVTIYEKDMDVCKTQIISLKHQNIKIINGDINSTIVNPGTFYDLDYCCTMINVHDKISKFRSNYAITLALRPFGKQKTISQFFKSMEESLCHEKEVNLPIKHTVYTTVTGNKYICAVYRDSSAMCCITKIN